MGWKYVRVLSLTQIAGISGITMIHMKVYSKQICFNYSDKKFTKLTIPMLLRLLKCAELGKYNINVFYVNQSIAF